MNNNLKNMAKKIEFPTIISVFTLAKDGQKREDNLLHLITSVFFVYGKDKFRLQKSIGDILDLSKNYESFNIRKLQIVIVTKDINSEKFRLRSIPLIEVRGITYENFFNGINPKNNKSYLDVEFLDTLNNYDTIFIFDNIGYSTLRLAFRFKDILISGGSNTKRHILSPLQLKLSHFITAVYTMNNCNIHDYLENQEREEHNIMYEDLSLNSKYVIENLNEFNKKKNVVRNEHIISKSFHSDKFTNYKEMTRSTKNEKNLSEIITNYKMVFVNGNLNFIRK